jgi:pentose-5-phosphate-3-epimerase
MVDSLPRVSELAALREKHSLDFLISIDGGVDYPNAIECARRGAEVYVTGVFTVFRQQDGIADACRRFQRTLEAEIGL